MSQASDENKDRMFVEHNGASPMTDIEKNRPPPAKDSLEFARSVVDTVREPLLILDSQLRVKAANRSFYRVFAVAPAETEERLIYELGNGQWDIPRLRSLLEEVLPKEHSFQDLEIVHDFEGIGRRRMLLNGRKLWQEGNHSELILLAIEDITRLWRTEIELKDSRERYRLIVEGATAYAIFTTDMHGMVTTWNPGAELIFGYSESEMLGQDARIIFTPADRDAGAAEVELRTAEADGRALDERWHLRKGGERFWANGLVMPLRDDADQTRGFLKILRDMSQQRELEVSLRQRSADLEVADTHKNEFLAMLAHELRNPLAAVRNALTLVTRSGTAENIQWSLDVINRQVLNFGVLIDDLLDVARITQGKLQLRRERVDATQLIHQAIDTVRPLIDERRHELLLSFTAAGFQLDADPTRVEQIIVNLLTNAAKYTPPGGRIQLTAGGEDGELVVRVRDNGVGIAPQLLPRLFELFTQADRSLARSEGGLGIGLTVVRSLTEMHGGTITASSEGPGMGSEFVLRLPVTEALAEDAGGAAPASEVAGLRRSLKVLVVDDNADTAKGMARLLELSGHAARAVFDGSEAIEMAHKDCPDVVLLDIGLPGMDGFEVAAELREGPCSGALLIAVSGYGDEESRRRSKDAGFDHHFVKPVDYDSLFALLTR